VVGPPPAAIRPADPAHLLHIGSQRVRRQPVRHGRGAAGGESNGTQRRCTCENILETVHVSVLLVKTTTMYWKSFRWKFAITRGDYNLNLVNEYSFIDVILEK